MAYVKFRFTNGTEHTAGLVMERNKYQRLSISAVSRLFPISEAPKMRKLQNSPSFETEAEAFAYEFPAGKK